MCWPAVRLAALASSLAPPSCNGSLRSGDVFLAPAESVLPGKPNAPAVQTAQIPSWMLTRYTSITSTGGVVRDLDFSSALVLGSADLLLMSLAAALDTGSLPAPHKVSAPTPVKPTGAITCCGPGDGTRMGGMPPPAPPARQPPVTITGVAPWAQPSGWKPGKGLDSVSGGLGGMPRPMSRSGMPSRGGGFTASGGSSGKPMTVAPWAQAPGSSISSALAKVAASKSMAHAASGASGRDSTGTSAQVDGAAAASAFVRDVLSAEECCSVAAELANDASSMHTLATAAHDIVERLCGIGGNPIAHAPPPEVGAASTRDVPNLNEEEQEVLAKSFKSSLIAFYSRFPALRAGLRLKVASCLVSEILNCQHIPSSHRGLRLHALDGGAKESTITLVGVVAALEIMTGMIRGFRKPPTSMHHLAQLREALLLLHVPNVMVDDRTPLLSLYHKPLCLALAALVECSPEGSTELLRALVAHWPSAANANSSKEVLLLHEIEMLLEHCPPETMGEARLRDLVLDTITSSFQGSKNFRVAERALLTFRSDGMLGALRQHHTWCVSLLVPKLLQAATEHWNQSVLRMIGTALVVLDEMDPGNFAGQLGAERAAHVRATALKLNPPEDHAKLAAEAAARTNALEQTRQQQDLDLYRLALGHELGVGAYSRVRFGKLIVKDLPQKLWPHVAVKIQDKGVMEAQGYTANVEREIRVLQRTAHPAIVRYVGSFTSRQSVYIAMEFLPSGDLQGALAAKGSLSLAATRFVTAEMLTGLAYLHSLDVVYGDLKPENVLLDEAHHAKLADFGSVRIVGKGGGLWEEAHVCAGTGDASGKIEGTAEYISPEVAAGTAPSSFASDAWAFGCVVFQLLAGHVPILGLGDDDETREEQGGSTVEGNRRKLRHIVTFTEGLGADGWNDEFFGAKFPTEARALIRRLLSRSPAHRLDLGEGGGRGIWLGIQADMFYAGVDFGNLPAQSPPDFSTGIVSAEVASDRKWNRRKQSMMWSPMPDKYIVTSSSSIPMLPEEPVGTKQFHYSANSETSALSSAAGQRAVAVHLNGVAKPLAHSSAGDGRVERGNAWMSGGVTVAFGQDIIPEEGEDAMELGNRMAAAPPVSPAIRRPPVAPRR